MSRKIFALVLVAGICLPAPSAWAQAAAVKLEVGAIVTGSDGIPVGTIEALGGRTVTVKLAWGKTIEPSPNSLTAGPKGFAMELTSEQLKELTGGSKPH